MSTIDSVITRILEDFLQDPNGTAFPSARRFRFANDGHRDVLRLLRKIRGLREDKITESFSIAASTETYTLTSLARTLRSIAALWLVPSAGEPILLDPILDGEEEDFALANSQTVSPDIVPGYYLAVPAGVPTLHVLPLASGTRNFLIQYEFIAASLTTGQALATPEDYDDLVAACGAKRARQSKSERDEGLEDFIKERTRDLEEEFSSADASARPRRVRDDVGWLR